ncbi:mpv17-like protein 2 [Brevipalpus obovatus]|uniref:mpv17-like protein 2 n=1 Tax=Brevipalpus obovatus TaxID=246614 RepID=UPI003D9F8046
MSQQTKVVGFYTRRIFHQLFAPKFLLITNTGIGGGFMWLADLCQQRMEYEIQKKEEKFEINWDRSYNLFRTGIAFGVVGHYWYKFLDWRWVGKTGKSLRNKLICEAVAGPFFSLGAFLGVGRAENKPVKDTFQSFLDNLETICMFEWFFYVPAQFFNFNILSSKYRFLYVAHVTFFYDIFLSYILHRSERDPPRFKLFQYIKHRNEIHRQHDALKQLKKLEPVELEGIKKIEEEPTRITRELIIKTIKWKKILPGKDEDE